MESRSWCANENFLDRPQFLQINFGRDQLFCKIATQGNNANNKWVKRFKLLYSKNGRDWNTYRENGKDKVGALETEVSLWRYHTKVQYHIFMILSIANVRSSHRKCSIKKVFLKISQISPENTCVGASF